MSSAYFGIRHRCYHVKTWQLDGSPARRRELIRELSDEPCRDCKARTSKGAQQRPPDIIRLPANGRDWNDRTSTTSSQLKLPFRADFEDEEAYWDAVYYAIRERLDAADSVDSTLTYPDDRFVPVQTRRARNLVRVKL